MPVINSYNKGKVSYDNRPVESSDPVTLDQVISIANSRAGIAGAK